MHDFYIPHVTLVTGKALRVADKLGLSEESLRFIEEASMLHDIGICKVDNPEIGCFGDLHYVCHVPEGRKILESEGLDRHARVCETHFGIALTKEEIIKSGLPLEPKDMKPESIEEEIISFADLYFSKVPGKLFYEKSDDEVREVLKKFDPKGIVIFEEWLAKFS